MIIVRWLHPALAILLLLDEFLLGEGRPTAPGLVRLKKVREEGKTGVDCRREEGSRNEISTANHFARHARWAG